MRPTELLLSGVYLFSAVTSAWPAGWEAPNNDIFDLIRGRDIAARQDQSTKTSFNLNFGGAQGNTATTLPSTDDAQSTQTGDAQSTDSSDDNTKGTGTNTGKQTGTVTGTGTAGTTGKDGTKTTAATSKTYDARLPAGGVSMITPNPMTTQYYKIADYVTFAWNYTSLSATPSYVDVLASCRKNQATYTLAMNLSVESTQTLVWDTGKYQATGTVPLLTETYTLIIHDAAKDVTSVPQAGYLGTYNQFTFGMYTPQPYTPLNDFVCATCNSAMTLMEKQTIWAIFAMAGITVMSFGWFTGVAGLW